MYKREDAEKEQEDRIPSRRFECILLIEIGGVRFGAQNPSFISTKWESHRIGLYDYIFQSCMYLSSMNIRNHM